MQGQTVTVREAAQMTSLSEQYIRDLIKSGEIAVTRLQRKTLIDVKELAKFLTKYKTRGRARNIMFCQSKGGVGKTTLTWTISHIMSRMGLRVLVIDLDPQASLSKLLGKAGISSPTTYTVFKDLLDDKPFRLINNVLSTEDYIGGHPNLFILPADREFRHIIDHMKGSIASVRKLNLLLAQVRDDFDLIFIDVPPYTMGLLLQMALLATDYVVIPETPDELSVQALDDMLKLIRDIQNAENTRMKLLGIAISRYKPGTILHERVISELRQKHTVFETAITDRIAIQEAQYLRIPLETYAEQEKSRGAQQAVEEYAKLATDIIEHIHMQGDFINALSPVDLEGVANG